MTLQDQLMNDLKAALRERDELRKSAIRMALAALKNERVAKNADLTEQEMIAVLRKEVRVRQDAIKEYEKGGREDLVAQESAAIEIVESYLPDMLGRDEIVEMAQSAIAETGASGPRDMGSVMRVLMPRVQGRADGRMVSEVVKELLANQAG
jgi:uncharacterized protein YqeY